MALRKITFNDKTDLNTTSVPDANKVKASDLNEIKSVINNNVDNIYPVGSIYLSTNSTNPGTLFGGTWVQVPCHELIESGTISSTSASGMSLGLCQYRLYANGDFEVFGYTQPFNIASGTPTLPYLTLPYTPQYGVCNVSIATGGANWASVGIYGAVVSNKLNFSLWNNNLNTAEALQFSFRAICNVDLQNASISTKYSWERTA